MNDRRFRHKWWGWGPEDVDFDVSDRPGFWPFVLRVSGGDDTPVFAPVHRSAVTLPARREGAGVEAALLERLGNDRVRVDDDDRLLHAYGRSYRDVVRLRAGAVGSAPDIVVYPESHDDVVAVVSACVEHDAMLVPFGGGTNVVGAVEHPDGDGRVRITIDMRRMHKLLSVDADSLTAVFEAGAFGPQVEEALAEHGLTLGHHPDSFMYSTLGGWIATRGAGSHSNQYGRIEDMVVGVRVVSPTGVLETRSFPAASHGPDWNRLIAGSEGTLGVITEATVRVHPLPEVEEYRMVLFRTFEDGLAALHECVRRGLMPSLARLSDEMETQFIFAAAPTPPSGPKGWVRAVVMRWLELRGYGTPAACVLGFEGAAATTGSIRNHVRAVCRRHGAFDLGRGPGRKWKKSRYDVPLVRDFMLDYATLGDAFETATAWSSALDLYRDAKASLGEAFQRETGSGGYLGCHVSHLYPTGVCLYFTIGVQARAGSNHTDMLDQYTAIKRAGTDAFVRHGGTLSHHHAVGYEHAPWMEAEHSEPARRAFRRIRETLDPGRIMAPGNFAGPRSFVEPR